MESLKFDKLSHTSLKTFYDSITARIHNLKAAEITGTFHVKSEEDTIKDVENLRQFKESNDKIGKLKSDLKKETQFNKKFEMNIEIKRLEEHIEYLKNLL